MDAAALIARLHEQRSQWVPLLDGRRVRIRRPDEVDFHRFVAGVGIDAVCEYTTGWEGFTEATFLGAAVGASDEVPFDAQLWAAYVRDHQTEAKLCVEALARMISEHLASRDSTAKN